MEQLDELRQQLNASLIEMEEEVECLILGMVAEEHVLFVGPPGVGKTRMCEQLLNGIEGATCFTHLLTKFTYPEEIFGPLDIMKVKESRHERLLMGYLPEAHIALVDEIWKASSAIINTMLRLMQERRFRNGVDDLYCPLRMLMAASNEYPVGEAYQDCGAAFDRMLIRKNVQTVSTASLDRLLFDELPDVTPCISLDDIDQAAAKSKTIRFSQDAREAFRDIVSQLRDQGIMPSPRRLRKSSRVAQAAALVAGHDEIEKVDLEPLQWTLWDDPREQPEKTREIVSKVANPVGAEVTALLSEAEDILSQIDPQALSSPETFSGLKKLEDCKKRLEALRSNGNGRAAKATEYVVGRFRKLRMQIAGMDE